MMPSLITSDRNAIPSPLEGLMIYNDTDNEFNFYDGTAWQSVGGGGSVTAGNGITVTGSTIDLGGNMSSTITTFQGTLDNMLAIQSSGSALGTKAGIHFKMFQSATNTQYELFTRKMDAVAKSGNSDLVMTKVFSTAGGYLDAFTLENATNNVIINNDKTTASSYGNFIVRNGNSGFGTISPSATLHVAGTLRIVDGNQGTSKVLTSDASGNATWQTPSGTILISNPGTRNLLAGDLAGAANTGTDNVFMGYSAGNANTSAGQNVFIGSAAGIDNITGGLSTIIGWRAGHLGTAIQGNTLIGAEAGRSSNASINTFVGEKSGENTTTGGENVMLGSFTGDTNITGSQLTIIGRSADVATSALTNATAIGSRAMVGQSNSLVLGSIAGVNSSSNNTNVGIGTTTPDARLEVEGDMSGGGMMIASYVAPTATASVVAATYSVFGTQSQTIIPVYIPNGTSQLRAKVRFRASAGGATSNIRFAITDGTNTDYSTIVSNTTTAWTNSAEVTLNLVNVVTRGWLTLQVEGQGDGANGPTIGNFVVYIAQ
jgi:hypothetical protein